MTPQDDLGTRPLRYPIVWTSCVLIGLGVPGVLSLLLTLPEMAGVPRWALLINPAILLVAMAFIDLASRSPLEPAPAAVGSGHWRHCLGGSVRRRLSAGSGALRRPDPASRSQDPGAQRWGRAGLCIPVCKPEPGKCDRRPYGVPRRRGCGGALRLHSLGRVPLAAGACCARGMGHS